MDIQQPMVLALAALMILVATKIDVAQLIEVLQRLGPGGGSPPNGPLQGDDSHFVLRRRRLSSRFLLR